MVVLSSCYFLFTYLSSNGREHSSFLHGRCRSEAVEFDQPALNDEVQVQVLVQSGAALWRARIMMGDVIVWERTAVQGEEQSYNSGWMQLSSGRYTFTFGTVGIGSLEATVTVLSKGGFR